jgi:hypothetical protein
MDIFANHCLEACFNADDECNGDEGSDYLHMIVNILFSYNSAETIFKSFNGSCKITYRAIEHYLVDWVCPCARILRSQEAFTQRHAPTFPWTVFLSMGPCHGFI